MTKIQLKRLYKLLLLTVLIIVLGIFVIILTLPPKESVTSVNQFLEAQTYSNAIDFVEDILNMPESTQAKTLESMLTHRDDRFRMGMFLQTLGKQPPVGSTQPLILKYDKIARDIIEKEPNESVKTRMIKIYTQNLNRNFP